MDAWFAVENGWQPPTIVDGEGATVLKPNQKWTTKEKTASRANTQALYAILNSLPVNQFTRVQGCNSAKEAWDIIQVTFEGTSDVKRVRLDILASDFENLTMGDDESIDDFSGKLSSIAQEAVVLGKRYKDKKLVKKFLRSLPEKFQPHRSAIDVSLNSDELGFHQVVGMMQAHELQMKKKTQEAEKSLAQKVPELQDDVSDDGLGLLVRKYDRNQEKGPRKAISSFARVDTEKNNKKSEKQCYECGGYRHFKAECPTFKRRNTQRCFECKGRGHTRADCVGRSKSKHKLDVTWSESDTDGQDADGGEHLVAHHGVIKKGEDSDTANTTDHASYADSEESLTVEEQNKLLMNLIKENLDLISERENMLIRISTLEKELSEEKIKSSGLEKQLSDQMRNIRMLSKGTKDLDKVLSYGRVGSTPWGLGYKEGATSGTTKFVKEKGSVLESSVERKNSGQTQSPDLSRSQSIKTCGTSSYHGGNPNCRTQFVKACVSPVKPASTSQGMGQSSRRNRRLSCKNSERVRQSPVFTYSGGRATGCWYCGKAGHVKSDCYRFQNRVNQLIRQKKFHKDGKRCNQVYIKKDDLYGYGGLSSNKVGDFSHFRHMKANTKSKAKANLRSVRALSRRTGCWYCGSQNHYKADCCRLLDRVIPHTYQKKCRIDDQVTDTPVSFVHESAQKSESTSQAVKSGDSVSQVKRSQQAEQSSEGSQQAEQSSEGSQQAEQQQHSVSASTTDAKDTALGSSCTQPMMLAADYYGMISDSF